MSYIDFDYYFDYYSDNFDDEELYCLDGLSFNGNSVRGGYNHFGSDFIKNFYDNYDNDWDSDCDDDSDKYIDGLLEDDISFLYGDDDDYDEPLPKRKDEFYDYVSQAELKAKPDIKHIIETAGILRDFGIPRTRESDIPDFDTLAELYKWRKKTILNFLKALPDDD